MKIKQSRINNLHSFLGSLPAGNRFHVTLTDIEKHSVRLQQIGFSSELQIREQVLPKVVGPISRFNAEGRDEKLRDKPKETCFRDGMIKDWRGNWHHVEIPYERYRRLHIPAAAEELLIEDKDGRRIIASRELEYQPEQPRSVDEIKHLINLFLELFGECDILSEALVQLHQYKIDHRNWRILPSGEYPWERAKGILSEVSKGLSESKRRLVDYRFEHLTKFNPSKLIIGTAGFYGYVIFCFEERGLYLLESRFTDNATYVFDENWETLSQLSKKEIINGSLCKKRIIHKGGWPVQISSLFATRNEQNTTDSQAA